MKRRRLHLAYVLPGIEASAGGFNIAAPSEGYEHNIIYTSRLKRAQRSTWTMINALEAPYLPVYASWCLNKRNYGALTGLKKADAARTFGVGVVQAW